MLPSLSHGLELEKILCEKFGIPVSMRVPNDRMRSLLAYRNDRRLYRRTCDMSGETMISAYHADANFPVIKSSLWWGDTWEALDYGFAPDLKLSFFDQFATLQKSVPREGTSVVNSENCEYNSHTRDSKNCYLNHLSAKCENVLYSHLSIGSSDCVDCLSNTNCTLCYDCRFIQGCYECVRTEHSSNCTDCHFSYQMRGCSQCILCTNLIGKKYYYRNTPCTPEEFEQIKRSILYGEKDPYDSAEREFSAAKTLAPLRASHTLHCEEVSGEFLTDCRRCFQCFDIRSSEDCFNLWNGGSNDVVHGYSVLLPPSEVVYCCVTIRGCQNIFFSMNCWNSSDLWYCDNCVSCSDCFGCIGLKKKKHCFFNVQYSEPEYAKLVREWREAMAHAGEWGEFFPIANSPFCYNESAAQDFFPLGKDDILSEQLRYREFDDSVSRDKNSSLASTSTPRNSSALSDGMILTCSTCSLRYRIIQREIDLYTTMHVPPPESCPDCRLTARIRERCPYALVTRECSHCSKSLETAYTEDSATQIVCEECFLSL